MPGLDLSLCQTITILLQATGPGLILPPVLGPEVSRYLLLERNALAAAVAPFDLALATAADSPHGGPTFPEFLCWWARQCWSQEFFFELFSHKGGHLPQGSQFR